MSRLPNAFVTGAGWPAVSFHQPPLVTISAPASGSTATAVVDPAGTETSTFLPGIRANGGINGANAVTGVTGVTAVTAVTAVGGFTAFTVVSTNGADQTIRIINGTETASVTASTATIAAPVTGGTGALAFSDYIIPAGASAIIRTTAAAGVASTATSSLLASALVTITPAVTVPVAGVTGVTAVTAVAAAALIPGTLPGKIQAIRLTSGGSGYGRGNLFQRWFTLNNGINQGAGNGQDYTIFGANQISNNNAGGPGGINHANVTGSAFDVTTGVTYIRDIHYGTGRRVD